jgi:hypothetical protein
MNIPQQLSIDEWKAVMRIPAIREAWGIEDSETPEQFADMVNGVKFTFSPSVAPGYMGDLFILQGDALGEPMTVIRRDGELVLLD